jgi:hypothetical protein
VRFHLVGHRLPRVHERVLACGGSKAIHQVTVPRETEHRLRERLRVSVRDKESGLAITDRIAKPGRVRRQ